MRRLAEALACAGLWFAMGCAPAIGDDCQGSADCSVNGDRICDRAQPGGYCTVASCEANTCPDDARCVEFRYENARHAARYCMARCSNNSDCRKDDNYSCVRAETLGEGVARVLESGNGKFCAQTGQ